MHIVHKTTHKLLRVPQVQGTGKAGLQVSPGLAGFRLAIAGHSQRGGEGGDFTLQGHSQTWSLHKAERTLSPSRRTRMMSGGRSEGKG